jgi:spore cortex protein
MTIRRKWIALPLSLACACALAACGNHDRNDSANPNVGANEAPPAAPFGINVQNQNDDNNIMKYKDSVSVHDEGSVAGLPQPEVSQRMADALVTMEGIHTAHVLVSGNQAFVAVTLRDGSGMEIRQQTDQGEAVSRSMKGFISDKIRTMDPDIRHVYVTDQTEYVRRFETIRTGMQEGRPVQGLLRELSESVTRIIPDWSIGNLTPPTVAP